MAIKTFWIYLKLIILAIKLILLKLFYGYICTLPFLQHLREKKEQEIQINSNMEKARSVVPPSSWIRTYYGWSCLKQSLHAAYIDFHKHAVLGGNALNVDLVRLDGTSCKLYDFMKTGKPLVLNFGSCT